MKKIIIYTILTILLLAAVNAETYTIKKEPPKGYRQGNCPGECMLMKNPTDNTKTTCQSYERSYYPEDTKFCSPGPTDTRALQRFACCTTKVELKGEDTTCTLTSDCTYPLRCLEGKCTKPKDCSGYENWDGKQEDIITGDGCCPKGYGQKEYKLDADCRGYEASATAMFDGLPKLICQIGNIDAKKNPWCNGIITQASQAWGDLLSKIHVTDAISWIDPNKWTTTLCNPQSPLQDMLGIGGDSGGAVYSCNGETCVPVINMGGEAVQLTNTTTNQKYYVYTFTWYVSGGEEDYQYMVSLQNSGSEKKKFTKNFNLSTGATHSPPDTTKAFKDTRLFTKICIDFYGTDGTTPKKFPFTDYSNDLTKWIEQGYYNKNFQHECRDLLGLDASWSGIDQSNPALTGSGSSASGGAGAGSGSYSSPSEANEMT